ncbi:DUF5681 domain-containing protein [Nitrobacter winogradskyi]|uniref:Uncharacterized protein n=2 Tax=Nitrobacter winogradskyi TaxID=913 RepID=A0ACC6AJR3_NITWI|nr:DUF5681 domain-containing protein [Nitrobacter winogradskyi]MCP2000003.1 hypothetical protein [Nitrobacter winogradskyi]GEC16621.1 hypothetical protein NWI01_25130 [Nitrobacter winogradskyi]
MGKGRPPIATRFKPGKSGNPKGRPKGSKNAANLAKTELNGKVVVTLNGRKKSMTVAEISSRRLGDKAMAGDAKAFSFLFAISGVGHDTDESQTDRLTTPEQDQAILAEYFKRRGFKE